SAPPDRNEDEDGPGHTDACHQRIDSRARRCGSLVRPLCSLRFRHEGSSPQAAGSREPGSGLTPYMATSKTETSVTAPGGYDPSAVEAKWQARWRERGTNETDLANGPNPFYALMMFPYPSAEGLHVGNLFAFTG